jgi:hypothetical protein
MKKIYSNNTSLCEPIFALAQGKCKERLLTAPECNDLLNKIVFNDLRGCPKCRLVGTKAKIHAYTNRLPQSYKYTAMNTVASYMHDGKGWILVSVEREPIKVFVGNTELDLSQDTRDYIIQSLARV